MNYWLFKSEPTTFSIDDLAQEPTQTTSWDGTRNYQVRNFLRDRIQKGDCAFFYHSNCKEPGIVGITSIIRAGYPDPSAWNPESKYYDPKSNPESPRWYMVDLRLKQKFSRKLTLADLKKHPLLEKMLILRTGNRLSVTPLSQEEGKIILSMV